MLTMTDMESPKFPFATPEDIKAASEKALNFWVGALSPMWVPFMAASSFGLGAWAVTRGLAKGGDMADLPLATRWPGFAPLWGQADFTPEAFEARAEDAEATVVAAAETAAETAAPVVEQAVEATEAVVAPIIDPVTEVPVVPAVVEALAEPVIAPDPVKSAAKVVAPKAIAAELAVARTRSPGARAAAKTKK